MPIISIIVPVYKVEEYIEECIQSILNQTFTDFELILVDDGSPDRSGEICDKFAESDVRIKVFHKENGGVSSARNFGIEHAQGEWLCFVDSDDYLDPTHLENYFENYKDGDNLLMCGHINHYIDIGATEVHTFSECTHLDTIEDIIYDSEINNIINSPVCKLFKSTIVNNHNLCFDLNTSYGEDHLFVLEYCMYVTNISFTTKSTYHYVHYGNTSLTRIVTNSDRYVYYLTQLIKKYRDLISKHNWFVLEKKIKSIISSHGVMAIIAVFNDGRSSKVKREQFEKIYNSIGDFRTTDVIFLFQRLIMGIMYLPQPISYIICKLSCGIRNFVKK